MQRLLYSLVCRFRGQLKQGPKPSRHGRPEVRDVIDLVFMQANAFDQIDVHFVSGGDRSDEVVAVQLALLSNGKNWRNIVTGMGVVFCKKGVVKVEFPNSRAIGPSRPLGADR